MWKRLWSRWVRLRRRWSGFEELPPVEGGFYVSSPITCHVVFEGEKTFLDVHHAEHDGTGYLVHRSVRIAINIDMALVNWAFMLERKNQDIPGMEVLAATLGAPGTDHEVAQMKSRRDTIIATTKFFASLRTTKV